MPEYDVAIDLSNPNTSHAQVVELVGRAERVLDIGCWNGDLGRVLMDGGCRVSGVELDADAAAVAARYLEKVVVLDLDKESVVDHFEPGTFDALVFADVLEHVFDPVGVLRSCLDLLTPEGRVVISLPNVAHGSLRLAHLQGRWDLTDTGLLDRTHIRFFNRARLFDLLEEAGLVVEELRGTTADPMSVEVEVAAGLPASVVEWVRDQEDAFVYQFQVRARRRRGEEPVGRRVPLVEAGDHDTVRLRDAATADHEQALRDRLRQREEIIGLQAETATLHNNLQRLRERNKSLSERLDARNRTIRELRDELARVSSSRIGRKARTVARRLLR